MKIFETIIDRLSISRELLSYFWQKKIWWMTPIAVLILLLAVFLIFAQGAAVAPFIYTLF